MIVQISELDKVNGELYMVHGNVDITMVISAKQKMKKFERIKAKLKVLSMLKC